MTLSNDYPARSDHPSGFSGNARRMDYPFSWRIYDALDGLASVLVPRTIHYIVPALMILPAAFVVGLLAYGFVLIVDQSLHVLDTATFQLSPDYTLANYRTIFSRPIYSEMILRTVIAGVVVSTIAIMLAFPYAYAMVRTKSRRTKKILLVVAFMPFLLGSVIRGYAWLIILGRTGIINSAFGALGFPHIPLMYNYTGVLIGLVQLNIPLAILLIAPALTAINEQIEEAAQSLGAHWTRALWTVVFPMALPGIATAFIIMFTLTFSDMVIPMMLGGGRADFIANAIYNSYVEAADYGIGAALCVLTSTAVIVLTAMVFVIRARFSRRTPA